MLWSSTDAPSGLEHDIAEKTIVPQVEAAQDVEPRIHLIEGQRVLLQDGQPVLVARERDRRDLLGVDLRALLAQPIPDDPVKLGAIVPGLQQ